MSLCLCCCLQMSPKENWQRGWPGSNLTTMRPLPDTPKVRHGAAVKSSSAQARCYELPPRDRLDQFAGRRNQAGQAHVIVVVRQPQVPFDLIERDRLAAAAPHGLGLGARSRLLGRVNLSRYRRVTPAACRRGGRDALCV